MFASISHHLLSFLTVFEKNPRWSGTMLYELACRSARCLMTMHCFSEVLSFPSLNVLYERSAAFRLSVPYVPGFLAMREVPALSKMFQDVPAHVMPQVVLVDGNGAFHPRGCGAATHLGISIDLPTIGVAKDVQQVGDVNSSTARRLAKTLHQSGDWGPLCTVAALLRTKGSRCLVVSPGHRVCLRTAVTLTSQLCQKALPEPIRQADLRSRQAVRSWYAGVEFDYLVAPRLSHLEHMLQITAKNSQSDDSPVVNVQSRRGRQVAKWVIKEKSKTEVPCEESCSLRHSELETSESTWTSLLFGWICVCFTR